MFRKLLTNDPDQIARAIFDAFGEYDLSFPRRQHRVDAGIVIAPDEPVAISVSWFGTATRQVFSEQQRELYGFTTCLRGQGSMTQHGMDLAWKKGVTLPLQPLGPLRLETDAAFKCRDVVFDKAMLHDFYERWSGRPLDKQALVFDLAPFDGYLAAKWAQAMHVLGPSGGGCDLPPLAKATFAEYLMALLLECHPHSRRTLFSRPAPRRAVRDAVRYIEDNERHALSIGEVAQASGCSIRSLQIGFRCDLGTTPHAYLAKVRMALAKNDLERGEGAATVADVAYELGFRHLGRFSSEFRSRFGEYPSEVLRKNRARVNKPRDRV